MGTSPGGGSVGPANAQEEQMARFFNALFLGFVLALVGWSCGSGDDAKKTNSGPDVSALAPADNAVPGWAGDATKPLTAGTTKIVRNYNDAVQLIDGSADPYWSTKTGVSAVGLAFQNYANGALTLELRVWQLASAADCAKVYEDLMTYSQYYSLTWNPPTITLGDAARISLTGGGTWHLNVRKGAYLIEEILVGDSTDAGQTAMVNFTQAILAKIP
jgi:hypothetical protein